MRTISTHIASIIWKRTPKSCKVFTLYTRVGIKSITVNTMLRGRMVRNLRICAMTTQLMRVVHPPTVSIFRIVTRVIVRASAYFTYSVSHN